MNGKLVNTVAENQPGSLTLIWNGTNYSGKRVNIGAYIVIAYMTDANGYRKSISKPIIVSTKLK
ncbi:MAG: hypothetical protein COX48_01970 [bacterium (Candidatus Stahlbacteria) CG23_combo_of_CG06-09_8_20_14_all_34_7]|nr:MAG: hypothetical protein COX48_01970 [bacterium (Candidatus Stahlbacteria) CG23_combo_of_CG06-09_8_20_14_all_34_7]